MGSYKDRPISPWTKANCTQKSEKACQNCARPMIKGLTHSDPPNFIAVNVYKIKVKVDSQVSIPGHQQLYRLCGIIYFGSSHFVARIIDKSGGVWYNDGYESGERVQYMGNIVNLSSKELIKVKRYLATVVIYTKP